MREPGMRREISSDPRLGDFLLRTLRQTRALLETAAANPQSARPASGGNNVMRRVHRSAFMDNQRCARRRFWAYEWDGTGLEPDKSQRELVVGKAVHAGLGALLSGRPTNDSVTIALARYDFEVKAASFTAGEQEQVDYIAAEQRALVEALVRVAALGPVPRILDEYTVKWVEQEIELDVAPGLTLVGQPDALLQHKDRSDYIVMSWKTKATPDDRAWEDAQHDDQGLSEQCLVNNVMGVNCSGVLMCWLFKGVKREWPKDSGRYIQASPLLHAQRSFRPDGAPVYATEYRRGAGWERIDTWREPGGVAAWIDRLAAGVLEGDSAACLPEQWYMPSPYYRRDEEITEWLRDFTATERIVAAQAALDSSDGHEFPKSRRACSYPTRCRFYQLCWGPPHVCANPLESGYRRRTERLVNPEVTA